MAHIINKETGKATYQPDHIQKEASSPRAAASARPVKNNFSSDDISTRDALNAFGFDNSKIGYDGTDVTYDGKAVVTPTQNIDGVTKTDTRGLVNGANAAYKNAGIDDYIVDVTEYAASNTLLPNIVKYHENGSVTLGSIPIENVVVINGNSLAPRSAVEAAVQKYKQQTGYATATEKANEYLSKTQAAADSYVDRINNYGPFAYDPESDPAYQAYKAAYMRNAQRAQEDTLAINNARTGGYSNSAAISAGNQAYYNHLDALNDRIPELMDSAYARYRDGYDMLFKGLEMYGDPTDRYKIAADANAVDNSYRQYALEADYKRDIDNRDFNYKKSVDDRDFAYNMEKDNWYRDHMYAPQSRLLWQDIELNDALMEYMIGSEAEKYKGLQLDNKIKAKKNGVKY